MSPAPLDPSDRVNPLALTLDRPSATWCYDLGADMRRRAAHAGVPVKADTWCPFRAGTPHRGSWMRGWRVAK